jgi:hypothetical protein
VLLARQESNDRILRPVDETSQWLERGQPADENTNSSAVDSEFAADVSGHEVARTDVSLEVSDERAADNGVTASVNAGEDIGSTFLTELGLEEGRVVADGSNSGRVPDGETFGEDEVAQPEDPSVPLVRRQSDPEHNESDDVQFTMVPVSGVYCLSIFEMIVHH